VLADPQSITRPRQAQAEPPFSEPPGD